MNNHRQIKFLLKEAEMYLQFLNEDIDAVESIGERSTSDLTNVLKRSNKETSGSGEYLPFGDQTGEHVVSIAEIVAYIGILLLGCLIIVFTSEMFFPNHALGK